MWSSGVVTSEVVLMGSLVYTLCLLAVTSGHEVRALGVPLRHHRVPVMMASEPSEATVALDATWCDVARIKCAHRQGCALALAHYVTDCADLVAGRTDRCHGHCQRALIALVSTDEGTSLVNCNCSTIEFCEQSKQRLEVCRPQVEEATAPDTVVSCTIAKWICLADIECSTCTALLPPKLSQHVQGQQVLLPLPQQPQHPQPPGQGGQAADLLLRRHGGLPVPADQSQHGATVCEP
ncbi:hypothetical protein HDE_05095 [Halotydeus destructor]|nr:hypothetical protein HDE_05095 [Halotydeus destructor]